MKTLELAKVMENQLRHQLRSLSMEGSYLDSMRIPVLDKGTRNQLRAQL